VEVCPSYLAVKTRSLYRLPVCPSADDLPHVSVIYSSSDVVSDDLPTIIN